MSDLNGGQTVSSTNFTNMHSLEPPLFNSFSSPPRPGGQLEFSSPLHPAFSSPPRLPAPSFSPGPTEEVAQSCDPEGMPLLFMSMIATNSIVRPLTEQNFFCHTKQTSYEARKEVQCKCHSVNHRTQQKERFTSSREAFYVIQCRYS